MGTKVTSRKQSRDITRVIIVRAGMSCFVALVGLLVGPLPRHPFQLGPAMTSEFPQTLKLEKSNNSGPCPTLNIRHETTKAQFQPAGTDTLVCHKSYQPAAARIRASHKRT
jgi:hypothetical protein